MVTPDLLALVDEIETRARKATGGKWTVTKDRDGDCDMIMSDMVDADGDQIPVLDYAHGGYVWAYNGNAAYIAAAHPQSILTLTAALREALIDAEAKRIALRALYEDTADYIRVNNLGDVHHNFSMQLARAALKEAKNV